MVDEVKVVSAKLPGELIGQGIELKPIRTALGNIRVSKPGDADYEPMCKTIRRYYGQGVTS